MQISESIEMVIDDKMVKIIMGGGIQVVYITESEISKVIKFLQNAQPKLNTVAGVCVFCGHDDGTHDLSLHPGGLA